MSTHRTIVVADHHKSVFVCQVLDQESGETFHKTLDAKRRKLEPFLAGLEGPVLVFVEACRSWEWVSDLCEDLGHNFRLVNARRMPEISRSTKKTDRRDVEAMVRRLMVEGDLPQSYRASRSQREFRDLSRTRSDLRATGRKLMLKIHAVIDAHGLPAKKESFRKPAWREDMCSKLSADAWLRLEVLLLQLDANGQMIERLEPRWLAISRKLDDHRRLMTVPGIGQALAATILAEAPEIERFKSARAFASYCGLVPAVRSSAGKAKHGHITKSGPSDLRWALSHAVMVSQGKNPSTASLLCRRKKAQRRPKKLAICAGANKLARIVWAMLVRGQDYGAHLAKA